jgi:hypothetical protein
MIKIILKHLAHDQIYEFDSYDQYIKNEKIGILQKLKKHPNFYQAEKEVVQLLGEIPSEVNAIIKAIDIKNNQKEEKDISILVFNNITLYQALLKVLVDHLLRSLGWLIWFNSIDSVSGFYALLKWYAQEFGIQKKASEMIVIREFFDYAQALSNVQNRIQSIFIELITLKGYKNVLPGDLPEKYLSRKPEARNDRLKIYVDTVHYIRNWMHENKLEADINFKEIMENRFKKQMLESYYREELQWQLCKFANEEVDLGRLKMSERKVHEYRNYWVHKNSEEQILKFKESHMEIIENIQISYKSVILKYEGLYKWYLEPEVYQLKE